MLMELIGQLSCLSTPEGSQQLSSLIGEQAELSMEFKVCISVQVFLECFSQKFH